MKTKTSPLKIGTETYGTLKIEEVFLRVLEVYFTRMKNQEPPCKLKRHPKVRQFVSLDSF
ncbi:hypothetical protein BK749_14095 [Bacillus thuringiensis serovar vazensis]|uniref:Uncharacterized protein n=1 Tax=Bacillus thuringiensis serovar vazensis TaxID=180867 RepID=A0A243CW49_BACTU|nr:hypothetical protein [Bacillus thuringiensis]EEM86090.1 hypothetical protein bthur0012_58850 [Bacillus thuringiensis serovar pulsiensis BGSC 4CC1]OTY75369.1 hypothetical protein BK749_14095 [Bacillus thuringiensis serovar vazensis]